jgi:tetratricopeptide (TPR) repeat protein
MLQIAGARYDQALVRLDQAAEVAPKDPEIRFHRGRAHLALGHATSALADLEFAAASMTDRSDVLYHLALAFELSEQPNNALSTVERALAITPENSAARDLAERLRR